jgi:hypothetical protein
VRELSLIHHAGMSTMAPDGSRIQTALSKHAAPPARKHAVSWALLALVSLLILLATMATGGAGLLLLAPMTAVAAGCAVWAARYNAIVFPRLLALWERSFMCGRCGEVFELGSDSKRTI